MGKKKHMTAGRRPGKDARKENLEQGMAIIHRSPLFAGIGGYYWDSAGERWGVGVSAAQDDCQEGAICTVFG